jgi:hypothetical protein
MYKVIWILADGRKKYSSKSGVPEEWTKNEIDILKLGIKLNGYPYYDKDLEFFFPNEATANSFGFTDVIKVVNFELEEIKN